MKVDCFIIISLINILVKLPTQNSLELFTTKTFIENFFLLFQYNAFKFLQSLWNYNNFFNKKQNND